MDKENVLYKYNELLLSQEKEGNNGICSNMDGPRETQISYDIACTRGLKQWYNWTHSQNSEY